MKNYLEPILSATTISDVCVALQKALDSMKANNYFADIPEYYQQFSARDPKDVERWFDDMEDDVRTEEEGNLKEIHGLYDAALQRLEDLGFQREQFA